MKVDIAMSTKASMAGELDGIGYNNDEDFYYFFGDTIETLVNEQDWNFSAEWGYITEDSDTQKLIDKYWAILSDEVTGSLTDEEELIVEECEMSWWKLFKDGHEIQYSYDCQEVLEVTENFPTDVLDYLHKHAPVFQPPTKEELEANLQNLEKEYQEIAEEIVSVKKQLESL